MMGLPAGSTATLSMFFPRFFLIKREMPVMVPPVPTPQTITSTAPSVALQTSGPVVCS